MKQQWALFVILFVFFVSAVVIIDVRPTLKLQTIFYRYYHLEKLSRFTKILDPVLAMVIRPTNSLRTMTVDVLPEDTKKMVDSLPLPYPAVFLSSENAPAVPAMVTVEGGQYAATVRIRGKSPRHWQDAQKSFRIDFSGEQPPFGLQTMHVVIPYDRYFIAEAYSKRVAESLRLLTWHEEPVWVDFNGTGSVYLLLGRVDGGMIERNALPVGLFYSETEYGNVPAFPLLFNGVESWRTVEQEPERPAEFAIIERLLALINEADDGTFVRELPTIIDVDQYLRWQAHAVLISSDHIDDRHNAQILLNPSTGNLTFFLSDPGFYEYGSSDDLKQRLLAGSYNKLAKRVLSYGPWRQQRDDILRSVLLQYEDEWKTMLEKERKLVLPWLMRDPIKLHSNLRVWWLINQRISFLKKHWDLLSKVLTES